MQLIRTEEIKFRRGTLIKPQSEFSFDCFGDNTKALSDDKSCYCAVSDNKPRRNSKNTPGLKTKP